MQVQNQHLLTDIFGYWPSFHDAEILSIFLERSGKSRPSLTSRIHVFEMTSEIGPTGAYVLRHHTLLTLRFEGVNLDYIRYFNHQNVLFSLDISTVDEDKNGTSWYEVSFDTSYGCEAAFRCQSITVLSVEPFAHETPR
jgi:hypothetical protein